MSDKFKATLDATKIQNGSYTDIWWDDEYLAEIKAFEAKDEFEKESVKTVGTLRIKHKVTGIEGKGSMTLYKINSLAIKKLRRFCAGSAVEPRFTIMSVLDDPSGLGSERIIYNGVSLDDLTWLKTEVGTLTEIEVPFTYESVEVIDVI